MENQTFEEAQFEEIKQTPAFPIVYNADDTIKEGLTVREYFVAAALTGILANGNNNALLTMQNERYVSKAIEMADLTIKKLYNL